MRIITPKNDTRKTQTECLVSEWANKLFDSTLKRDFALRNHFKRQLPAGLRSKIYAEEAKIAINHIRDLCYQDAINDAFRGFGQD